MDFKLTVEYNMPNMCDEEDLKNRSPLQIFNDVTLGQDYYRLYSDKVKIKKLEIVYKNGKKQIIQM